MTPEEGREKAIQASITDKSSKKLSAEIKSRKDNVAYTLHNMEIMTLPPLDCRICSAEELQQRCFDYMELCTRDGMKPSLAGLALSLDVSRQTLIYYVNGTSKIPTENRMVLQRFNGVLNALAEDYMQNGKINPVAGIFLMKNNFGYKDMQEYVVNNNVQEETTPEGLIEEANLLLDTEPKKANIEE